MKFCFKNVAVDCTWEEWGEWSACPDECQISNVFRTREKNEHSCGGSPCTGLGRQEENCDRFADLKMEKDQCQQNLIAAAESHRAEITRLNEKMCLNVLCNHGGTCQEGECICRDGFFGSSCERNIQGDNINTGK